MNENIIILTIREHFESFPEPYRTQAIENTKEADLERKELNKTEALYKAFTWDLSPQGIGYWFDFRKTLKD